MIEFSAQVRRVAEGEDLTLTEIERMVRLAARCTHERGNRRFHDWVFAVQDAGQRTVVERMVRHTLTDYASGAAFVLEDCESCEGQGCHDCGWAGVVKRLR